MVGVEEEKKFPVGLYLREQCWRKLWIFYPNRLNKIHGHRDYSWVLSWTPFKTMQLKLMCALRTFSNSSLMLMTVTSLFLQIFQTSKWIRTWLGIRIQMLSILRIWKLMLVPSAMMASVIQKYLDAKILSLECLFFCHILQDPRSKIHCLVSTIWSNSNSLPIIVKKPLQAKVFGPNLKVRKHNS